MLYASAFEAANKVLAYTSRGTDGFVESQSIINAVKSISGYSNIGLNIQSFKSLDCNNAVSLLNINKKDNEYSAKILINSDVPPKMQRFALAHELGHILTNAIDLDYITPNDGKFTISSMVSPDVTLISNDQSSENKFILAEQLANIFAILVLVPDTMNIKTLSSVDIDTLLSRYGVTSETIYSKLILDNI